MRLGQFGVTSCLMFAAVTFPLTAHSKTPGMSDAEIGLLRAQGQAGLQTFLKTYSAQLLGGTNPLPAADLRSALDRLCQQRDCHASRLYWYTDLEQAKAVAQAEGKPILSLRLLGRLDEELSCANSRFFRITLYPNAQISQLLRDRFVLHWQSVRPVPKVSIDFGDGRKLERTLTGNSIHYILDSSGRPIEALPGLYGPQAFLRALQQANQLFQQYNQQPVASRETFLQQYHRDRLVELQTAWVEDLQQAGIKSLPKLLPLPEKVPTAEEAGRLAIAKMMVEIPVLQRISMGADVNRSNLAQITDEVAWKKLAQLHAADARLDQNSQALMRSKNPQLFSAASKAVPGTIDPFDQVLQKFEAVIALDTVRNEYLFRSQLHQWFVENQSTHKVDTLNERVYAELFLTPSSDPWLGLSGEGYTAIENDGISR